MAEERQETGKKKGNEIGAVSRNLPRNYRQIGEPGAKKIYVEDYVYTYLNKLAQPENLYARGAILFGKMYKTTIGKCMFISGAAACQNFELDLDETIFSEENWGEIYRIRDSFFPELEICGWFLSRMGFSVDLNDKIIRIHMDNFSGENKVLYMIDALENEDAFYQFENYSLKKQRGYYIYYETNQEMKNYKKALRKKKSLRPKSAFANPAYVAGGLVAAMVLIYGVRSAVQYQGNQKMQEVFQQQEMTDAKNVTGAQQGEEETDTVSKIETTQNSENEVVSDEKAGSSEISEESNSESAVQDTEASETQTTEKTQQTWGSIGGYYTVKRGDTLAGISKKMYQSYNYIEMIAEANGIDNVDEIYPGQILEIPQIED